MTWRFDRVGWQAGDLGHDCSSSPKAFCWPNSSLSRQLGLRSIQTLTDSYRGQPALLRVCWFKRYVCSVARHVRPSVIPCPVARQAPPSMGFFPGKNTGMGCHFLLQGTFKPASLISCIGRQILYYQRHLESPLILLSPKICPHWDNQRKAWPNIWAPWPSHVDAENWTS